MSFFGHHLEHDDWGRFWQMVARSGPIDPDLAVAGALRLFAEIHHLWDRHLG
jgi:hypothetical protein